MLNDGLLRGSFVNFIMLKDSKAIHSWIHFSPIALYQFNVCQNLERCNKVNSSPLWVGIWNWWHAIPQVVTLNTLTFFQELMYDTLVYDFYYVRYWGECDSYTNYSVRFASARAGLDPRRSVHESLKDGFVNSVHNVPRHTNQPCMHRLCACVFNIWGCFGERVSKTTLVQSSFILQWK